MNFGGWSGSYISGILSITNLLVCHMMIVPLRCHPLALRIEAKVFFLFFLFLHFYSLCITSFDFILGFEHVISCKPITILYHLGQP